MKKFFSILENVIGCTIFFAFVAFVILYILGVIDEETRMKVMGYIPYCSLGAAIVVLYKLVALVFTSFYQIKIEKRKEYLDEIPNALMVFDTLFPIDRSSWLFTNTYSNITILRFMPLQLSGVGANFRRIIYGADDEHLSYEDLGKQFASKYTLSDLIKYNNLLIEYLFMDPKIRV